MADQNNRNDFTDHLIGEVRAKMPFSAGDLSPKKRQDPGKLGSLGFVRNFEEEKREDELNLVSTVERQVNGVLSEVQYIAEILATHTKYKGEGVVVENLNEKIRKSMEKIEAYMNPQPGEELTSTNVNRRTSSGANIDVEQNPLIKEMGGMPLEIISPEWDNQSNEKLLDKTELENQVKKLKDRVKQANELKAKHKLTNKPTAKPGQSLTPKFQKLQQTVKYIARNLPEPPKPAPAPRPTIAPPRPY